MFVSNIKNHYEEIGLPKEFADCLPDKCPSCSAPMEISETLTGLHCSNPRCPDKMVMRIKAVCNDLNILNFGESAIQKFLNTYEVNSPLDILGLEHGMPINGMSKEVSDKLEDQIAQHKEFLLWEYIMIANIPGVRTSARKIFQGYSSLQNAYKDIEEGGVDFIKKKLDLTGDENGVSVQSIKIYNNLMLYKNDLFSAYDFVKIRNMEGIKELNVVCSDEVGGGFKKKAEFYNYVNKTFEGRLHVNFLPSVTRKIDYLVWQGADGSPARYTRKVETVYKWNDAGKTNIPIVTATQFIIEMKEKYS